METMTNTRKKTEPTDTPAPAEDRFSEKRSVFSILLEFLGNDKPQNEPVDGEQYRFILPK